MPDEMKEEQTNGKATRWMVVGHSQWMQEEGQTLEKDNEFIMHVRSLAHYLIDSFIIQYWQHL